MANGVCLLLQNRFFDPSTPFMRKDPRSRKQGGKLGGGKEKTDENSGHYFIASSPLPKCRPLEHRTLVPKTSRMGVVFIGFDHFCTLSKVPSLGGQMDQKIL